AHDRVAVALALYQREQDVEGRGRERQQVAGFARAWGHVACALRGSGGEVRVAGYIASRYIPAPPPGVKAGNGRRRKERRRGPDRVPRLQIPRPRPGGGVVVKGPPSPSPGRWGGGAGAAAVVSSLCPRSTAGRRRWCGRKRWTGRGARACG